jgi:hypothetical protein
MFNKSIQQAAFRISGSNATNIPQINTVTISGSLELTGASSSLSLQNSAYKVIYLTTSGSNGTTSGIDGCTMTSTGSWNITKYGCLYFIDPDGGNINVTIPDPVLLNDGKWMKFAIPKLTNSKSNVRIVTTTTKSIATNNYYDLYTNGDRVELVVNNFSTAGAAGWKYRISDWALNIDNVINVSIGEEYGYKTIKSAVDYLNSFATAEASINVHPGTYNIGDTITINCAYPIHINGDSANTVILAASGGLQNKPMFNILSTSDIKKLTMYGSTLSGYRTGSNSTAIKISANDKYVAMEDLVLDNFNKAVHNNANSELWLFNSIISSCSIGLEVDSAGVSKNDVEINNISDCGIAVNLISGSNSDIVLMQNWIRPQNSGQIAVKHNSASFLYDEFVVQNNAWNSRGTFLSGINFGERNCSSIVLRNNATYEDKSPHGYFEVIANATATVITTQNVWTKATWDAYDTAYAVKFGTNGINEVVYYPSSSADLYMTVASSISFVNNNITGEMALVRNGTFNVNNELTAGEVIGASLFRAPTGGQSENVTVIAYFDGVQNNDRFNIVIKNTSSTSDATVSRLNGTITSQ